MLQTLTRLHRDLNSFETTRIVVIEIYPLTLFTLEQSTKTNHMSQLRNRTTWQVNIMMTHLRLKSLGSLSIMLLKNSLHRLTKIKMWISVWRKWDRRKSLMLKCSTMGHGSSKWRRRWRRMDTKQQPLAHTSLAESKVNTRALEICLIKETLKTFLPIASNAF